MGYILVFQLGCRDGVVAEDFKMWRMFCLSLFVPLIANAQSWPTKPVRFITGFGAGGSSDVISRIISGELTQALGKQVVIDNRSGGNGVAGTAIEIGRAHV